MADIIGILSSAFHAVHKVYDVVKTIKEAPGAVRALRKEASRVKNLLAVILPTPNCEPPLILQSDENPLVKALAEDARELDIAVEAFIDKVTKLNTQGTREVKRIRWPLYARTAKEISEQLRAFHVTLSAVCAVSTSYVLLTPWPLASYRFNQSADVGVVKSLLVQQGMTINAIHATVSLRRAAREQRQGRNMAFDELCATQRPSPPMSPTQTGMPAGASWASKGDGSKLCHVEVSGRPRCSLLIPFLTQSHICKDWRRCVRWGIDIAGRERCHRKKFS